MNNSSKVKPTHMVRQLLEVMYRESYTVTLIEHTNGAEFKLEIPENGYTVSVGVHDHDTRYNSVCDLYLKVMVSLLRAVSSKVSMKLRNKVIDFLLKYYPLLEPVKNKLHEDVKRLIASNDVYLTVKKPEDLRHSCLLLIDVGESDVIDGIGCTITSI